MGAVQARCWRLGYAGVLPAPVLDRLSGSDLAGPWHAAVTAPPTARHAVLVACAGTTVIGLAALAPSTDADADITDAELVALEVDPAQQRAGHGSRLLAAVVDTARDRGFTAIRAWVAAPDDARRTFLESAGLRTDGARRRLRSAFSPDGSADRAEVAQERWAAALPS
jgi:GNAT superfamily N-acetyltransferase